MGQGGNGATGTAMKRTLSLAGQETSYVLKRSSRRSVGLRIDMRGLTVSAPLRMAENRLEGILHQKSAWILKKMEEMRGWSAPKWSEGEVAAYLGRDYTLRFFQASRVDVSIRDEFLEVSLPDASPSKVEAAVEGWYRRQALPHFAARIAHYCPKLGVGLPKLFLSNAKTRWGSCNSKGEVRLNWRLIRMAPDLIDYVVAHELAHLIEMNHSAAFWHRVEAIFPGYATARATLKRSRNAMW